MLLKLKLERFKNTLCTTTITFRLNWPQTSPPGRRRFSKRVDTADTTGLGSCSVSHWFYSESGTLRINVEFCFLSELGPAKI